ncbi:unnamed protein product [Gongylonema pulchrum]|uniref:Uncharacterized protein n=1 Tax=Gongylonema pulchrum TaxID=637853 RepID=A0A3P6QDK5_9BILA|nr:unnamed protein product [Gongylonema pulchrum]
MSSDEPTNKDFVLTTDNDIFVQKITFATPTEDEISVSNKPDIGVEAASQNEFNTALSDFDFGFQTSSSKVISKNAVFINVFKTQ